MNGKFSSARAKPGMAESPDTPALNHEHARIQSWLRQVRFKKTVFGGVDEADVWKKLSELNSIYEAALSAERARYDALLAQRMDPEDDRIPDSVEYGKGDDET